MLDLLWCMPCHVHELYLLELICLWSHYCTCACVIEFRVWAKLFVCMPSTSHNYHIIKICITSKNSCVVPDVRDIHVHVYNTWSNSNSPLPPPTHRLTKSWSHTSMLPFVWWSRCTVYLPWQLPLLTKYPHPERYKGSIIIRLASELMHPCVQSCMVLCVFLGRYAP